MRTLYLDCGMGAAGDMLTGALLELSDDREEILSELNSLLEGVSVSAVPSEKCGITGTHVIVKVNGMEEHGGDEALHGSITGMEENHHGSASGKEGDAPDFHSGHDHSHTGLDRIAHMVEDMPLSDKVKGDIMAVYGILAAAESEVHSVPVSEIHFHEVGTLDAVMDIAAVCLLIEKLAPQKIIASAVHVGAGSVRCAHGILPVPAPATALILKGVPVYGGSIKGELCTPTGAALLKYFADGFGDMPVIRTEKIGYGMGRKDFGQANCLRVLLGSTDESSEQVCELLCNTDDMTGEEMGFATEILLEEGALEVFTTPVGMKKNRPGILLSVMCRESDRDRMVSLIFKHTSTIGIRENIMKRYTLNRRQIVGESALGPVRKKISEGYGTVKEKIEYEDLAKIARENGISIAEAKNLVNR